MLKNLIIKNYALIEHLEMAPSSELNIITGETGAGKSIMLGAIGLLLGKRADVKALYNENEKCIIEGAFDISSYNLTDIFEEEDLDHEPLTIIRREISPTGKSRAFINDTPATLDTLKRIGTFLMDIHSQHDTLLLGSNNYQLSIIDSYAQNQKFVQDYQRSFKAYIKAKREYESLKTEAEAIKSEAEYHQYLWEELSKAQLESGEQETLEEDLKMLENAEEIKIKLNEALQYLSQSEFSVQSTLYNAQSSFSQIAGYSQKYSNLLERIQSTLIEIKDINEETEKEELLVEYDPEKIERVNERLNLIYKLQQKHKVATVDELLEIQAKLEEKVQKIQNVDSELEALEKKALNSRQIMLEKAENLSASRKAVLEQIQIEILDLLKGLGMPDASIEIIISSIEPASTGIDQAELLFSANKGIKPQELKNVASGGEFSRLMFCIKYILADKTSLPTIIFDEIDTGISGAIALKMVNMMKKMARAHQVISISHLPQIAAKGDAHYFVYKDNSSDKTMSKIKLLTSNERVEVIATMLGGDNPSAVAYENARELMSLN